MLTAIEIELLYKAYRADVQRECAAGRLSDQAAGDRPSPFQRLLLALRRAADCVTGERTHRPTRGSPQRAFHGAGR